MQKPASNFCPKCKGSRVVAVKSSDGKSTVNVPCDCVRQQYLTK